MPTYRRITVASYLRITEQLSLNFIRLFRAGDLISAKIGDLPHHLDITITANHPTALQYAMKHPGHFLIRGDTIVMLLSLKALSFKGLLMYWVCYPHLIRVAMTPNNLKPTTDNPWLHVMNDRHPTIVCQNQDEADLFNAIDAAIYSIDINPYLQDVSVRLDELKIHETVLATLIHRHLQLLETRINRS